MQPVELSVVHIGGLAKRGERIAASKSYAQLYKDIAQRVSRLRILSGFHVEGDENYDFFNDSIIDARGIDFTLFRNNSPSTSSREFIRNYVRACRATNRFVRTGSFIFIIMPSAIGAYATLQAVLRGRDFAFYVGGNWSVESQHARRATVARKLAYPLNRFVVDGILYRLARRAQFIICSDHSLYNRLQQKGYRVFNPVPLLSISINDSLTREDTCRGDKVRILYVGALRAAKGVSYLLDAFRLLIKEPAFENRLELWVAGAGEMRPFLEDQCRHSSLSSRVRFWGHVADPTVLRGLLTEADIFAFPSLSEGFPRVLYEAALMSLPIVTTDVGGIDSFFVAREECLLVPPANARLLANAIAELVSHTELRQKLIVAARERVRRHLDWTTERWRSTSDQITELVTECLERKERM